VTDENPTETLRVRSIVPSRKEKVFRAWTEPSALKQWWTIGEGWRTSFAEVDLRVGGRFTLGNEQAGGTTLLITGEFLEIEPPDKLVYTWRFPGETPENGIVTVEFKGQGDDTEVIITHEQASKAMAPGAIAGWGSALWSLKAMLTGPKSNT
jgi:uncharacterized protein YndB with AHSA1/START domain